MIGLEVWGRSFSGSFKFSLQFHHCMHWIIMKNYLGTRNLIIQVQLDLCGHITHLPTRGRQLRSSTDQAGNRDQAVQLPGWLARYAINAQSAASSRSGVRVLAQLAIPYPMVVLADLDLAKLHGQRPISCMRPIKEQKNAPITSSRSRLVVSHCLQHEAPTEENEDEWRRGAGKQAGCHRRGLSQSVAAAPTKLLGSKSRSLNRKEGGLQSQ